MGRHAVIILAMRIAGTVLWLGYTMILARTLSPDDFASAIYIVNFALVGVMVVSMGRDQALLQFASLAWIDGARRAIRDRLANSRWHLAATSAGLVAVLLAGWVLGLPMRVTDTATHAVLTGLITGAAAQMGLNRDCLRATGRIWQSQVGFALIRTVVPLAGGAAVLMTGRQMTLDWALILFLVSLLLSLVLEAVFLHRVDWQDISGHGAPSRGGTAGAGLAIWPGDIANALLIRSAGLIGALALEPKSAALLLAAERIAALAQFPVMAASQASAPRIAQAIGDGPERAQAAIGQGSLVMAIGAFAGTVGAAALSWPALRLLGGDYPGAILTALVLISASLSWAFFGLAQSALIWSGNARSYSAISAAMAVLVCVAIAVSARHAGPLGAAVAWSAGLWLTNIAYTVALSRRTGLSSGLGAAIQALGGVRGARRRRAAPS